jgi:hypothetical protein
MYLRIELGDYETENEEMVVGGALSARIEEQYSDRTMYGLGFGRGLQARLGRRIPTGLLVPGLAYREQRMH